MTSMMWCAVLCCALTNPCFVFFCSCLSACLRACVPACLRCIVHTHTHTHPHYTQGVHFTSWRPLSYDHVRLGLAVHRQWQPINHISRLMIRSHPLPLAPGEVAPLGPNGELEEEPPVLIGVGVAPSSVEPPAAKHNAQGEALPAHEQSSEAGVLLPGGEPVWMLYTPEHWTHAQRHSFLTRVLHVVERHALPRHAPGHNPHHFSPAAQQHSTHRDYQPAPHQPEVHHQPDPAHAAAATPHYPADHYQVAAANDEYLQYAHEHQPLPRYSADHTSSHAAAATPQPHHYDMPQHEYEHEQESATHHEVPQHEYEHEGHFEHGETHHTTDDEEERASAYFAHAAP
jgi:hypothetical protein